MNTKDEFSQVIADVENELQGAEVGLNDYAKMIVRNIMQKRNVNINK